MNILLVDDHAIVRTGLRRLLSMVSPAEITEASTGKEGITAVKNKVFDVVVLDLNLPDVGGIELLTRIRQIAPTPILVLSMHAEALYVRRAFDAGAQGYVSKNASPEELLTAVKRVASGGHYIEQELAHLLILQHSSHATLAQLAPRDLEILRHLAAGKSLSEIASALGLGYKTIANNCSLIKAKLGVSRMADLLRLAKEVGVV